MTTVRASVQPASLTVDPGSQAACTVTVRNTGSIVERFSIVVLGATSGWADVDPSAISLLPDAERTVTVTFRPARGPVPNAGTLAFAVKIIPTKQADDTVVEEGDITITPFVELVPGLRPRASRGATVGHHVLRVTNRGNAPVDVALSASDPDDLLTSRVRPPRAHVGPGATVAARVDLRPRQRMYFGPRQPRPFQARVQPDKAPVVAVDGTFIQRPILPKWLPRVAAGLVVVGIGTALYASRAARVKNVAVVASATSTLPPVTTTKATAGGPTTVAPGGPTTATTPKGTATTTGGSPTVGAAGSETGVKAQDLSCDPYDPTSINVTSAPAPPAGTTTTPIGTTTTSVPVLTVATNNPNVTFQFTSATDAQVAQGILAQYQQVCYIGKGALLATQLMVLEPFQPKSPNFPQINQATEKCDHYNNAPGTLVAKPPGGGHPTAWLADTSATPMLDVQDVDNQADAKTALTVAQAHSQRCWIGGGQQWTSLDHPPGSVLEYWR